VVPGKEDVYLYTMKKIFTLLSISFFFINAKAQEFPRQMEPPRNVNDYCAVLNDAYLQKMETTLHAFNDSTDSKVMVVIVPNTGKSPIADYAGGLFSNWSIGKSKDDMGVLILLSKDDKHAFIQSGAGLSKYLPAELCTKVSKEQMEPALQKNDWNSAVDIAANQVMDHVMFKYKPEPGQKLKPSLKSGFYIFVLIIGAGFVIAMVYYSLRGVINEFKWSKENQPPKA